MPRFETSLSVGYQPAWSIREAVREVVSNAIDGQTRGASDLPATGKMTVEYFPRTERLVVTNAKTRVPASALLLGQSDSRSYGECIGTFGEGLPLALLVLCRLRYTVTIYNGDEKWAPAIETSEVYGEDVLVIKTRALRKERDFFSVEIEGITEAQWSEYRRMFLPLHPEFDPTDVGASVVRGEQILFQACMKGKIFNKGVLVTELDSLSLGYDFNLALNRDRNFVDSYEIQRRAGQLLMALFDGAPPEQQDLYFQRLTEHRDSFELADRYGPLSDSKGFQAAAQRWWDLRAQDPDQIAVDGESERKEAEQLGFVPVCVPGAVNAVLSEKETALSARINRRRREVTRVFKLSELTADERAHLVRAVKATRPVRPAKLAGRLVVAAFRDAEVEGSYKEDKDQHQYLVSRSALCSAEMALKAIVQAFTTAIHVREYTSDLRPHWSTHHQMAALTKLLLLSTEDAAQTQSSEDT